MSRESENQPEAVEKASLAPANSSLVEDVLLLLFQPDTGSFAGETHLYFVLGGAAIADLAGSQKVEARRSSPFTNRLHALDEEPPSDDILHYAWSYIAKKPPEVQTALAVIGAQLREPALNRLVERGDLNRKRKKMLRIFTSTSLTLGNNRREELLNRVRAALIDGKDPNPRIAATIALLSASGTLAYLNREIPWSGNVFTRAKEFEKGNWAAVEAGHSVSRAMTAAVINPILAART